jgi:hypothetical protein
MLRMQEFVKSMTALKHQTAKLGAPKIEGKDAVGGRDAPALYFGSTKMNNDFSVVDAVAEEGGRGMAATLFVKSGADYIRVTTSVSTRKGSGRGIGTVLSGAPLDSIRAGNAYYGKVSVLGTSYISGYEPIKDGRVRLSVLISSGIQVFAGIRSRRCLHLRGGEFRIETATSMKPTDSVCHTHPNCHRRRRF